MAKNSLLLIALCLVGFMPTVALAESTVEDVTIYCPSVGGERQARVYLPDGYAESNQAYPVVYFLQGTNAHYSLYWAFLRIQSLLDALIESGTMQPIIFVMPDGLDEVFGYGCWYVDSELFGNGEAYIAEDVVNYLDDNYNTLASRDYRALVGHSMGGFGSVHVGLRNPGVFASVVTTGPVLDLEVALADSQERLITGADPGDLGPPYEFHPDNSLNPFTRAGAWSPNLDNPPYHVDLPIDENGEFVEDVVTRWMAYDAGHLAEDYATMWSEAYPLNIWIGCGVDDSRLPHAEYFADALSGFGIPHVFEQYPGGHYVVPIEEYLTWLSGLMPIQSVALDLKPGSCPNGFNPGFGGVLPVALLGDGAFDVSMIDPESVRLNLDLAPAWWSYEDAATPFAGDLCDCWEMESDGYGDLSLKFSSQAIADVLGEVMPGDEVPVTVSGWLTDGTAFVGEDCLTIRGGPSARVAPDQPSTLRLSASSSIGGGPIQLTYEVPDAGLVTLSVFDLQGRRVTTLHQGNVTAGSHRAVWDGRLHSGAETGPGIYFIRVESGGMSRSQKVVMAR